MNTEMNTEVKTIKVKKTKQKKNIPLIEEVVNEPIDLFKEQTIIDEENEEVWDDIKQDIEYETEKQKLLKQLEKLEQENALRKNAKKYKTHIVDMLEADIKSNEDAIQKFQDELLTFKEQLVELETIENDTDIMDYLADKFSEEVNELINDDMPKPIKQKKQKKTVVDDGKEKPERKANTKKEEWDNIPEGTEFRMIYKKSGIMYMKSKGKLVRNDTGVEYTGFHQAVTVYAEELLGKKVSLKGWESFERVE